MDVDGFQAVLAHGGKCNIAVGQNGYFSAVGGMDRKE